MLTEGQFTTEQRIEVTELQVAYMREQIGTLMKQLPWLATSPKN